MGARRPFRPGRALTIAPELPAQHIGKRFRRHAVGIEEALPVEMIGRRTGIGFHAGSPNCRKSRRGRQACEDAKKPAAGEGHVAGSLIGWESRRVVAIWLCAAITRDRPWTFTPRGST